MIKTVHKVWGREEWIANNDLYCGKKLILLHGFRCSMHHHMVKHETFYVEFGKVLLEVGAGDHYHVRVEDVRKHVLVSGDSFEVPPGLWHRFSGITGLELPSTVFEFSTHHEDSDSYRATESGPVPDGVMREYA